ncbi:MAG: hypothetical protein IAE80_26170, partial [Anaerolinea sp.]|nr:hypothetical protein [Anaerolinea sp.]
WTLDDAGLPAYEYTLDQYADARAKYYNIEGRDRRDHWHQIGNHEITALASNDGIVQAYVGHRGGRFLNRFATYTDEIAHTQEIPAAEQGSALKRLTDRLKITIGRAWLKIQLFIRRLRTPRPKREPVAAKQVDHVEPLSVKPRGSPVAEPVASAQLLARTRPSSRYAFGGGFGYVDDGEQVWCTAFRYRPPGLDVKDTKRIFGMGYVEYVTTYRQIKVTRRIYAPFPDPALRIEVEIENLRSTPVDVRYYEYWDVNAHQLKLQWLRGEAFYAIAEEERLSVNDLFMPEIEFEDGRTLRFHQKPVSAGIDADGVNDIDFQPHDIYLHDLSGTPDAYYADKFAFFGSGSPGKPEAVSQRYDTIPDAPSTDSMPYCLVLRRDLRLAPNGKQTQEYLFGTCRFTRPLTFQPDWLDTWTLSGVRDYLSRNAVYFNTGEDPALTREMAWHSYYLDSATLYNDYYKTHLTPQGSAYLYIHGADGAPRDQALFTVPLVYMQPDLARGNLRLLMALTDHRTGAIPYSFSGHGFHSDAYIHDAPSDLDIFFLLALNEYLAATGDFDFLKTEVPFYSGGEPPVLPPDAQGITALDHVRAAVHHLTKTIGKGAHGLIKIGDGDWSDGVVFDTATQFGKLGALAWFANSKANGESVPNSQMALYVLPLTAALLTPHDAALADRITQFLDGLEAAVMRQWNGAWFTRAVLRDAENDPVVVDNNRINLEAQPWALISGTAERGGITGPLVNSIKTLLDDPSPTGAPLLQQGMIWPAVSQLLTWGYTRSHPDLAWNSLKKHAFTTHADEFAASWINIWSGPDGVHCKESKERPGGTWASAATPMTDFPVMNMNPHAMALLALVRVCGIEPTSTGLRIAPCVPRARFVLDTALLRLIVEPGMIAGEYRPVTAKGSRMLTIRLPDGARLQDGADDTLADGTAVVKLAWTEEQPRAFRVRFTL